MKNIDLNKITEVKMIYASKVKASGRPIIKNIKDPYAIIKATKYPGKNDTSIYT